MHEMNRCLHQLAIRDAFPAGFSYDRSDIMVERKDL